MDQFSNLEGKNRWLCNPAQPEYRQYGHDREGKRSMTMDRFNSQGVCLVLIEPFLLRVCFCLMMVYLGFEGFRQATVPTGA